LRALLKVSGGYAIRFADGIGPGVGYGFGLGLGIGPG